MAQSPPPSRTRGRWVAAALSLAYTGAIFALSHTARPLIPDVLRGWSDKLLHALEYAPLASLWGWVFSGPPRRRALLGWAVAGLLGLTDEFHQWFVPGRQASLRDWLADVAGAFAGAALLAWILTRKGRGEKRA